MSDDSIIVKFTAKRHRLEHSSVFLRQFPGRGGLWGNCRFVFDPEVTEYDWLVAYDDLASVDGERFSTRMEELRCPAEHTIFVTMEPSSIKTYGADFLNQFGVVLTSQEPWAISGSNTVYAQPALRWYYGADCEPQIDYDTLATAHIEKTADLSSVCSNKRQSTTLHAARFEFSHALKEVIPEMRLFGRGINPIQDKSDAIRPFRYHIAIENHWADHHWTEKLSDVFLGEALPFYYGCPNLEAYFDEQAFIRIDLHDIPKSLRIIKQAIANNEFEKRLPAIQEAKRQVLDEYNLFAVLQRLIEERHSRPVISTNDHSRIYSRRASRNRSLGHRIRYGLEYLRVKRRSLKELKAA